jgi:hypothetical protein
LGGRELGRTGAAFEHWRPGAHGVPCPRPVFSRDVTCFCTDEGHSTPRPVVAGPICEQDRIPKRSPRPSRRPSSSMPGVPPGRAREGKPAGRTIRRRRRRRRPFRRGGLGLGMSGARRAASPPLETRRRRRCRAASLKLACLLRGGHDHSLRAGILSLANCQVVTPPPPDKETASRSAAAS